LPATTMTSSTQTAAAGDSPPGGSAVTTINSRTAVSVAQNQERETGETLASKYVEESTELQHVGTLPAGSAGGFGVGYGGPAPTDDATAEAEACRPLQACTSVAETFVRTRTASDEYQSVGSSAVHSPAFSPRLVRFPDPSEAGIAGLWTVTAFQG
jgi:hypothetical protein